MQERIREIVLDTETTGLEIYEGHKIIEIGCIELINRVKSGKTFHVYVNPERDIPQESYNVHGIPSSFLQNKPLFSRIAKDFLAFIENSSLIIHNAAFDIGFLNHELAFAGLPPIPMGRAVDTLTLARKKFPGMPANLDALCKRFNISLQSREKHGALIDSELLAQVYLHLLGGPQSELKLSYTEHRAAVKNAHNTTFPTRKFLPSKQEAQLHEQLVRKMKNPVWLKNT